MDFVADQMCFACGRENPIGLRLTFAFDGAEYVTRFTADARVQGYRGIIHGGIVATLLDEVMARLVWEQAGPSATARLDIRYRRPAPIGAAIEVRGRITAVRRAGQLFETAARATLADGTVLADATGLVMRRHPAEGGA
ncbi:MAG TPA: PaaI family thioesterase [Armatimonadota bacterium]|nr:PaaI family thioesterase [Armatimonadota bacterium]